MFVIGITGGIGSGKSSVAALCAEAGLPVIDADQLSHQVTAADGRAIPDIVEAFGRAVILEDGALNRDLISSRVFSDRTALDLLSKLVHRHVVAAIEAELAELKARKVQAAVLDVPIPVKHGFQDQCHEIWVVRADRQIRLDRLERRGLNRQEAERRMAMQMTDAEYEALADHVIDNSQSLQETRAHVALRLTEALGSRGIRFLPLL